MQSHLRYKIQLARLDTIENVATRIFSNETKLIPII